MLVFGWAHALWIGWRVGRSAEGIHQMRYAVAVAGAIAASGVWMPWWGRAGSFGNVDLLAGFLAVTIVWTVIGSAECWGRRSTIAVSEEREGVLAPMTRRLAGRVWSGRAVLLGAALVQGVVLFRLESWGAFFAVFMGLGGAFVWSAFRRWGGLVGAGVGATFAVFSAVLMTLPSVIEHLSGRLFMSRVSITMLLDRPLTGVGAGGFPAGWMEAQTAFFGGALAHPNASLWTHAHHAHNEFLHVGAELGGLGLVLFTAPIALAIMRRPPRCPSASRRPGAQDP